MPQDNPRSETQRSETQRSESSRSETVRPERTRSERSQAGAAMGSAFGDIGARNITAGLRLQKEMLDVFQDIGREWFARASSEAELAFRLPNKLSSARSISDALSCYSEWLGEWMSMCGEDSRRLVSNGQKIIDTGVRCMSEAAPSVTS